MTVSCYAEGTGSWMILCLMLACVCFVLYRFVPRLILWILRSVWFDDLCAQWLGDGSKFVFCPDVILCG